MKNKFYSSEILLSVVFIVLSVIVFIAASSMPKVSGSFPKFIAVFMFILSGLHISIYLFRKGKG